MRLNECMFWNLTNVLFPTFPISLVNSRNDCTVGQMADSTAICSITPRTPFRFPGFKLFNFTGWSDAPEVLEPLLFYVLHRASNEITNPIDLGTFKLFLMDEAWLFIRNETIRSYIVQAQKTWRKHNAAMILATQSLKELEESGMLQIVSESCPTKIFLLIRRWTETYTARPFI